MSKVVIDKLRSDEEYYGGVGKNYLSNSDIGTLLKNPKEFGISREDNKNFVLGRYFHQLILEPEKAKNFQFVDVSSRNTKAYKEFCMQENLEVAMLLKEKEEVEKWVDTISMNLDFYTLIHDKANIFEEPAIGELFGVMWKGKADIVGENYVYDLKTSSSIEDFKWKARAYNYDSQAYIYSQLFGRPMMFLVIDKMSLMLGKYIVSDETLEKGKQKVEKAVEVYQKFYGQNRVADVNQFYYDEEI
jgi:hypothetical protein